MAGSDLVTASRPRLEHNSYKITQIRTHMISGRHVGEAKSGLHDIPWLAFHILHGLYTVSSMAMPQRRS